MEETWAGFIEKKSLRREYDKNCAYFFYTRTLSIDLRRIQNRFKYKLLQCEFSQAETLIYSFPLVGLHQLKSQLFVGLATLAIWFINRPMPKLLFLCDAISN